MVVWSSCSNQGQCNKLLLDILDNFLLSGGVEGVTVLPKILDQVPGEITSGKIETEYGMGESETHVEGDGMGDTTTRVQADTARCRI